MLEQLPGLQRGSPAPLSGSSLALVLMHALVLPWEKRD